MLIIAAGFRPLIRGFFFYTKIQGGLYQEMNYVSIPSFGDSFFITLCDQLIRGSRKRFPSPHSGILFLYPNYKDMSIEEIRFPSPHSGILFLYLLVFFENLIKKNVSVPSFGDSFFISIPSLNVLMCRKHSFRPLIRGFFFYRYLQGGICGNP